MSKDNVNIRQYEAADKKMFAELLRELQDHIATIDPYRTNKPGIAFDAELYVEKTLENQHKFPGAIFIAEHDKKIVGCIVGTIHDDPENVDHYACKFGFIDELVVAYEYRSFGVGAELMNAIETHFRKNKCRFSRTVCFSPNIRAYAFYKKFGYADRSTDLIKELSSFT